MEKLINSIPPKKVVDVDKKTGVENYAGFCLRFNTKINKWTCSYGRRKVAREDDIYISIADDPVEAVAFFVELFNKHKQ